MRHVPELPNDRVPVQRMFRAELTLRDLDEAALDILRSSLAAAAERLARHGASARCVAIDPAAGGGYTVLFRAADIDLVARLLSIASVPVRAVRAVPELALPREPD